MNHTPRQVAETPVPLNERWPQVLRYGLHPAALTSIIGIAIGQTLVAIVPAFAAFFIIFPVWGAFFKYALEVLRWSANGHDEPPEVSLTVSHGISFFAVLLLLFLALFLIFLRLTLGAGTEFLIGLLLMLPIPAIVTILALDEGPARALNPMVWLMIMARIGNHYFVLVAFFWAALLVRLLASAAMYSFVPWLLAIPASFCVMNYLTITSFHLIGIVIHEHRDELGYAGHVELGEVVDHTDPSRPMLDAARERAANGDEHGAAELLREELRAHPELHPLHDEYRHWLHRIDAKPALLEHGKSYIPMLLEHDQDGRAIQITRECQTIDPKFALDKAEHVTRVAHAAAEAGHTQVAMGLLAGFHKRFRNHPHIARNYLLAAKLWAERMNKEMQARALLQQIKVTMPDDPVIPQVDEYLAFLDKIAATPAGTKPAPPK